MTRSLVCTFALLIFWVSHAAAQSWATKMFKTTQHDFGSVARGSKAEFDFEFQNLYEEEVHIASVRSSCGCATPEIANRSVKTWEKSAVKAIYNTRSFLGHRNATITVVFDKPFYAETQLTVTGYIRSDVVFDPGEVNFGEVDQFSVSEKTVHVSYAGRSDWRIVDVRSANQHFEVELTETQRSGGHIGYDMLVRLKPDAPAGYFQDELTLVTDDNSGQSLPIAVQGSVVSPLVVSPASLFLGVLEPGQKVTKQLVVRGKQPFKVVSVKCEDDGFKFEMPGDEKKTLHFLPVTFTAGQSPGKIAQKIEIATDLAGGAVASCVATATIQAPAGAE